MRRRPVSALASWGPTTLLLQGPRYRPGAPALSWVGSKRPCDISLRALSAVVGPGELPANLAASVFASVERRRGASSSSCFDDDPYDADAISVFQRSRTATHPHCPCPRAGLSDATTALGPATPAARMLSPQPSTERRGCAACGGDDEPGPDALLPRDPSTAAAHRIERSRSGGVTGEFSSPCSRARSAIRTSRSSSP